jgi:phosphoribosyl 1,2-cyclic phosphodiesterase
MLVHLCGTRGSVPAPGPDFVRYGGNTSCVAITADGGDGPSLILDAGTGLRSVSGLLGGRAFRGTILLSHLHWDHVHGLPFFAAGDTPGARVRLVLPAQGGGLTAEAVLEQDMSPPHFPITPAQLSGAWTFDSAEPGPLEAGCFSVLAREVPHKGGRTFGYRVTDGRSTLAYLPDHDPMSLGRGPDGWGAYHPAALELAAGADVLIHDAFLLADELDTAPPFGHAAAEYAIGLARAAGARRVVLFHHRPDRTDAQLDKVAAGFTGARVPVTVGADGETLRL